MVNIQEKIEKGYIHAKAIIEMAGAPKEHVEQTLKNYIARIGEHENFKILNIDYEEAKEMEDQKGVLFAFAEIELLTKDLPSLTGFCFDYMPSSVEVLGPENMKVSSNFLTHVLNDLQGKLHKLDLGIKQMKNENMFVQKNMHLLLQNFIIVLLGNNGRPLKQIATLAGMEEREMEIFLEGLVKKGILEKEGDLYKKCQTKETK